MRTETLTRENRQMSPEPEKGDVSKAHAEETTCTLTSSTRVGGAGVRLFHQPAALQTTMPKKTPGLCVRDTRSIDDGGPTYFR